MTPRRGRSQKHNDERFDGRTRFFLEPCQKKKSLRARHCAAGWPVAESEGGAHPRVAHRGQRKRFVRAAPRGHGSPARHPRIDAARARRVVVATLLGAVAPRQNERDPYQHERTTTGASRSQPTSNHAEFLSILFYFILFYFVFIAAVRFPASSLACLTSFHCFFFWFFCSDDARRCLRCDARSQLPPKLFFSVLDARIFRPHVCRYVQYLFIYLFIYLFMNDL